MIKLLLPALIPSWRFFDMIAPSPRVQFVLLTRVDEKPPEWHEFRPRPAHLSFLTMLGRMLWNPRWNESMYIVSCAERLMESPTRHSEDEIINRIMVEVMNEDSNPINSNANYLQFRLLVVERTGADLQETITYYSRIEPLPERQAS